MAYSFGKDNIHVPVDNDEFSCPLCCELFQEPKLLPNCAHNFCKSCLVELVKRSGREIFCPVCRVKSRIPPNGAAGFATNTLLVRLIDNIPGRKESMELEKSLDLCKEEIERKKETYRQMEAKYKMITRDRELAEGLKKDISTYADKCVEAIKKYEKQLCAEVDAFAMQKCGLKSLEKLEKDKIILEGNLNDAASAVVTVKRVLTSRDRMEVLQKTEAMKSQLKKYLNIPTSSILKELGEICKFDMEFNCSEINMDSGLGKVFSKQMHSKEADTASVQQNRHTTQKESKAAADYSKLLKASGIKNYNVYEGTVTQHIPLDFKPFAVAVSPQNGDIALLCEERRQVHLFNAEGFHYNTIHIKYGDLWDVAFSIDGDIIVVNRANNRLLFYTDRGQFINREVEVPRTCLKFTYLSVDEMGRLIVTSTRKHDYDEDDDEIVQCLIVYQSDYATSDRMFGRKHLQNPVSRAIFFKGKYYVADRCSQEIFLRVFSVQGEQFSEIAHVPTALTTSDFSISRDPFSDRFIMCCWNNSSKDFLKITDGFTFRGTSESTKLYCHHGFPKQVAAQSASGRGNFTYLVEIYHNKECCNIVKYPV